MKDYKLLLYLLFSSILLCTIGFVNQYPLVTSDTGAYISNIFGNLIPRDRPITYSIFIYLSSIHISLWTTVIIQSAWLAMVLHLLVEKVIPSKSPFKVSFFIITLLTFFTCLSWYTSQVMADIFTSINFICLYLLIMKTYENDIKYKYFLWISLAVSMLMHNSNMLITLLFIGILYFATLINRRNTFNFNLKSSFIIAFVCILSLCFAHLIGGYGFTMSRTSHVFLMGKMSENGILHAYLNENCETKDYYLCTYKDSLPQYGWEYVWNEDSPLNSKGHWDESKMENREILKSLFTSPKYLIIYSFKCIADTFKQFFSYKVGDGLEPATKENFTSLVIFDAFQSEYIDYEKSLQNKEGLDVDFFNKLYLLFLMISIVFASFIFMRTQISITIKLFILMTLLFLLLNAFITANLANVLARLQSRVIWLIPLACWLLILNYFLPGKEQRKVHNNLENY